MTIERSEPAAGVHLLTLARPPANALSPELLCELSAAHTASVENGARAVVIAGQPGMFSAGLDVPLLLTLDRAEMARFWRTFFGLLAQLARSPVPVGIAITGHCPAGGTVLALFADYRIAAKGDFKLGLNEVRVGLPMPRLIYGAFRRLVGPRAAEQLGVAGELVNPETALKLGLVDAVAPLEEVVACAITRAEALATLPPDAMSATRALARADLIALLDDPEVGGAEAVNEVWFSAETQTAMRALVESLAARRE